ncbi:MAG: hypothetical protein NUV91_05485, partial [Candidatus Omnitrophica bacterium]|nr:hypothetical protein [Candidatus Omnitrophota bacterium]
LAMRVAREKGAHKISARSVLPKVQGFYAALGFRQEVDEFEMSRLIGRGTLPPIVITKMRSSSSSPAAVFQDMPPRRGPDEAMFVSSADGEDEISRTIQQWVADGRGNLTVRADDGEEFEFRYEERSLPEPESRRQFISGVVQLISVYQGDQRVGYLHFEVRGEQAYMSSALFSEGYIHSGGMREGSTDAIFVRSQGYERMGTSLMGLAMRLAQEKGARQFVASGVYQSGKFYKSLGFDRRPEKATTYSAILNEGMNFPAIAIRKEYSLDDQRISRTIQQWVRQGRGILSVRADDGAEFEFRYEEKDVADLESPARMRVDEIFPSGKVQFISMYRGTDKVGYVHFSVHGDRARMSIGFPGQANLNLGGQSWKGLGEAITTLKPQIGYQGMGVSLMALALRVAREKGAKHFDASGVYPDVGGFYNGIGFKYTDDFFMTRSIEDGLLPPVAIRRTRRGPDEAMFVSSADGEDEISRTIRQWKEQGQGTLSVRADDGAELEFRYERRSLAEEIAPNFPDEGDAHLISVYDADGSKIAFLHFYTNDYAAGMFLSFPGEGWIHAHGGDWQPKHEALFATKNGHRYIGRSLMGLALRLAKQYQSKEFLIGSVNGRRGFFESLGFRVSGFEPSGRSKMGMDLTAAQDLPPIAIASQRPQPPGSPAGVFQALLEAPSDGQGLTRLEIARRLNRSARTIAPDLAVLNRLGLIERPQGAGTEKPYVLRENARAQAERILSLLESFRSVPRSASDPHVTKLIPQIQAAVQLAPHASRGRLSWRFATFIQSQFPGRKRISFADIASGPQGEFAENLKAALSGTGIELAEDSVSIDNALINLDAEKAGKVRRADILYAEDRASVGLTPESKDLITINNIINTDLIDPTVEILKPDGILLLTFAQSDIDTDSPEIMKRTRERLRRLSDQDNQYEYQVSELERPADYPDSNAREEISYSSHSRMFVVLKVRKTVERGQMQPHEENSAAVNGARGRLNIPGGIDFNPVEQKLNIEEEGAKVPIPGGVPDFQKIHIDGLTPVIIKISPATNLRAILGLDSAPKTAPKREYSLTKKDSMLY